MCWPLIGNFLPFGLKLYPFKIWCKKPIMIRSSVYFYRIQWFRLEKNKLPLLCDLIKYSIRLWCYWFGLWCHRMAWVVGHEWFKKMYIIIDIPPLLYALAWTVFWRHLNSRHSSLFDWPKSHANPILQYIKKKWPYTNFSSPPLKFWECCYPWKIRPSYATIYIFG